MGSPGQGRMHRTDERKAKFLAGLRAGKSITAAASAAGTLRQTAYDWRKADPEFARAWDDAEESGTDRLEDVAYKRAMNKSDNLLIFMLKGRRREKYGDKVDLSGRISLEALVAASMALPAPEGATIEGRPEEVEEG